MNKLVRVINRDEFDSLVLNNISTLISYMDMENEVEVKILHGRITLHHEMNTYEMYIDLDEDYKSYININDLMNRYDGMIKSYLINVLSNKRKEESIV